MGVASGSPGSRGTWRTYTTAHGLAGLRCEHIAQDREGYIWIATCTGGASRLDGDEFQSFTTREGLCGNRVYCIHPDRQGRLWFATGDGGVCWHDGRSFHGLGEKGGVCSGSVSYIFEDRAGRLWFGGEAMGYCDGVTFHDLRSAYLSDVGHEPHVEECRGIAQDAAGHLWFGMDDLVRYDGTRFHVYGGREGLPEPAGSYAISQDLAGGGLWIGSREIGRFDGCSYQRVPLEGEFTVRKIQQDRQGRTWFSTNRGALCYDGSDFHHFTVRDGLAYPSVNAVLEDREDHIWFATWGGGVSCQDPRSMVLVGVEEGLPQSSVSSLLEDRRGDIWMGFREVVGTEVVRGVARYDGRSLTLTGEEAGLESCRAICEDGSGHLWLGDRRGLVCYDGHSFRRVSGTGESPTSSTRAFPEGISAMAPDGQGGLLLGHTWEEQDRFIVGVTHYEGGQCRLRWQAERSSATNYVSAILATRSGDIWFGVGAAGGQGSGQGLGCLRADGEVALYTVEDGLPDDRVEALTEGRQGILWIGTVGGLSRFDGRRFQNFTKLDGLPIDNVQCLYRDRQGHLWIGTESGVAHYDGGVFQTIRSEHIGSTLKIMEDRAGTYWFGTRQGLVGYVPGRTPPHVRILQVVADRVYAAPEAVEIHTSTRQVVFEYKGLSFRTHPRDMLYTCKLEGRDEVWQTPARDRRAYYRDLSPGEYAFRVKAIDQDMNYSEPAAVELVVMPDPYLEALVQELDSSGTGSGLIGRSAALHKVKLQLEEVAPTKLTVLILGKTGTGKGLAARTIHRMSRHKTGPLIQINCGAIPASLVESELFGHERGAFTGAVSRKLGKVELAAGGTLFLDEIGDLTLEVQVKLLRLLEERTFERVGGIETLTFEGRVIAASNRDLEQMVAAGQFREDLFYRLQVFPIQLPTLADRKEDISLLASYFMERMAQDSDKEVTQLTPEAVDVLTAHDWPGNVRELMHTIQRAVIVCRGAVIWPEDLGMRSAQMEQETAGGLQSLEAIERVYISRILEKTRWVVEGTGGAATILGLAPSTLRHRMKKLGIQRS